MKKYIFNYLAMAVAAFLFVACNDSESDLLEPKVYFEKNEFNITLKEVKDNMDVDVAARLSNHVAQKVDVAYSIAEAALVDEYNKKHGTEYKTFDAASVTLAQASSTIEPGQTVASKVKVTLNNLIKLEEGDSYVLPIRVRSTGAPTIDASDIQYIVVSKPFRVTNVATFNRSWIRVVFPDNTNYQAVTFEALVYCNSFGSSSTVIGSEGDLLLRIGDKGGNVPENVMQTTSGTANVKAMDNRLEKNKWYHLAMTWDRSSGKVYMYINGEKVAESSFDRKGYNPNDNVGFNIGMLKGFPWGERPLNGYMSEVRLWSVARTENQIKQNMLGISPKTPGLELYYKLNGNEKVEGGKIKDSTQKHEGTTDGFVFKTLDTPINIE